MAMFRLIDTPSSIQDSGVSSRGKGLLIFLSVLCPIVLWCLCSIVLSGPRIQDGGWSQTRNGLVLILAGYCSLRAVRLFAVRALLGEWLLISGFLLTAPIWIDLLLRLSRAIYTGNAG
jgi:hypothetical protein